MSRPMLGQVASGVMVVTMLSGGLLFAQRGGSARMSRGAAAGSVSRVGADFNRSAGVNRNVDVNRNANVNRNVDVNRDVNWDRDVDVNVDHHYGGWGYGCCYNPVATAAAAAAVTTAAVVGSVVHALPPSCEAVSINGFTYQHCGSTWYQPQFSGPAVTYVVVNPPR